MGIVIREENLEKIKGSVSLCLCSVPSAGVVSAVPSSCVPVRSHSGVVRLEWSEGQEVPAQSKDPPRTPRPGQAQKSQSLSLCPSSISGGADHPTIWRPRTFPTIFGEESSDRPTLHPILIQVGFKSEETTQKGSIFFSCSTRLSFFPSVPVIFAHLYPCSFLFFSDSAVLESEDVIPHPHQRRHRYRRLYRAAEAMRAA